MSKLFIVATPIGNLDDITLRAINTLREADVIACEDTRHTQTLLTHLGITGKRLIACHAHNEAASSQGIVGLLGQGLNVAYCSDAGTPGVSDPGSRLVRAVREAGFDIVPIPGASASVTLISASGLAGKTFTFEGFLSPKSGRRKSRLKELLEREEAFIIYESPFRILKTLGELRDLDDSRHLVLGREMTKAFEQFIYGTPSEVIAELKVVKGEFALVVLPPSKADTAEDGEDGDDNAD
ncbi:MAG: 16S rRNA (cytidine(1402)-2'-O)-methyltransferase [Spirochaetales bacterium]|nr:16S rRNA (cytidine(1402)-2'-O)-methyltransferase [Spirochaetales bacterium]